MIKKMLLTAPDSELDVCLQPIIEKWSDEPTAIEILEVLDQAVYSSLASEFVIILLQGFFDKACARENTTLEQLKDKAFWRK